MLIMIILKNFKLLNSNLPSAMPVKCIFCIANYCKNHSFVLFYAGRMWSTHSISRTQCHRAGEKFGKGVGSVCTGLFWLTFSSWLYHARASSQTFGLECWRCPGSRTHTSTSQSNLFSMSPWRLWGGPKKIMQRKRWADVCSEDINTVHSWVDESFIA